MNWKTRILSVALAGAASALLAQDSAPASGQTQTTHTTTTQQQNADGSTTMSTKTTTITGDVVSYEPGHSIVVRDANRGPVTYTIGPSLTVPADVQVGRRVTILSEPADGSVRVTRISTVTTSSVGAPAATGSPDMNSQSQTQTGSTTTESTHTTMNPPPDAPAATQTTTRTTKTRTTTVAGTVQAYQPGQSITIVGPGNKTTTYVVTSDSQLPQDVAVGKVVTVQTSVVSGKPVAQSVTYKTTTKTTHTKSITPQ